MSPGYEPLFVDFSRMAEVKPSSCPAYTSTSKSRMRSHRRLRTSRLAHDRQAVTPCLSSTTTGGPCFSRRSVLDRRQLSVIITPSVT